MKLSQPRTTGEGEYTFMEVDKFFSHASGTLTSIVPPKVKENIVEYLFYAQIGMDCTFPPGPNDDLGWIVGGSKTTA